MRRRSGKRFSVLPRPSRPENISTTFTPRHRGLPRGCVSASLPSTPLARFNRPSSDGPLSCALRTAQLFPRSIGDAGQSSIASFHISESSLFR